MMKQQFYVRMKNDRTVGKVLEYRPGGQSHYYDMLLCETTAGKDKAAMFVMVNQNFDKHFEIFYEWEDDGSVAR